MTIITTVYYNIYTTYFTITKALIEVKTEAYENTEE